MGDHQLLGSWFGWSRVPGPPLAIHLPVCTWFVEARTTRRTVPDRLAASSTFCVATTLPRSTCSNEASGEPTPAKCTTCVKPERSGHAIDRLQATSTNSFLVSDAPSRPGPPCDTPSASPRPTTSQPSARSAVYKRWPRIPLLPVIATLPFECSSAAIVQHAVCTVTACQR